MNADRLAVLVRFARELRRAAPSMRVWLEPAYELDTVAFNRATPDRLYCGMAAYRVLVDEGFAPASTLPALSTPLPLPGGWTLPPSTPLDDLARALDALANYAPPPVGVPTCLVPPVKVRLDDP